MTKKEFFIKEAESFVGKEVTIKGWVYNKRSSGSITFLQIRDGTGFIQGVVVRGEVKDEVFQKAKEVTLESSVIVKGILREEKRAPGGYELTVNNVEIINLVGEEYPIGKKEHGPDFLLTHRHLWLISRRQWAIQRIRNIIINAIYDHLGSEGFIKIDAPILTPNAC